VSRLGDLGRRLWARVVGEDRARLRYWERRARRHGVRSVLNLGHRPDEVDAVTGWQRGILFPLLRERLTPDDRVVLDFGCGPGRFTPGLAELLGGRAIGVDPIARLLELAPAGETVSYRRIEDGRIPLADGSVDVVWVALVLCMIPDGPPLRRAADEIRRVLRPGGLLFVVENTAEHEDRPHINFRSPEEYAALLAPVDLTPIGAYEDLGERITVLAGRAPPAPQR
jgi:SAM-dependent methyltransferase